MKDSNMDMLERFKELYCWNLQEYRVELLKIGRAFKHGQPWYFYNYGQAIRIKDRDFSIRCLVGNIWSLCAIVYQEQIGELTIERVATAEEDINDKKDFLLKDLGAVQYKVRDDYPDVNCARYQPYSYEKKDDGRDYVCLMQKTTNYHYVAIYDNDHISKIHRVESSEFLDIINEVNQRWIKEKKVPKIWKDKITDTEVKYVKNEGELYGKYIFYTPCQNFKTVQTTTIDEPHKLNDFYKSAYDYVVNTFIVIPDLPKVSNAKYKRI